MSGAASTAVLYTPEVLGLAVELAAFPLDAQIPLRAEARSRTCGSTLTLGIAFDADDRVERVGLRSQACAIGQASAAIFARAAVGRSAAEIAQAAQAVEAWLSGGGALPAWPGLDAVAAARNHPGRHGALLLPWNAAVQLLFMQDSRS